MDDLLREFLTETHENLDVIDVELVRFEQEPNNAQIIGNIFRLVHTIKGTCGFLNLPRLEALTHAAEALIGKFRDGSPVDAPAVTLVLSSIDRIKDLLDELARHRAEPAGDDNDLIHALTARATALGGAGRAPDTPPRARPAADPGPTSGRGRDFEPAKAAADGAGTPESREPDGTAAAERTRPSRALVRQSIRVSVDMLERLMETVSELVLTRNQLVDIMRRLPDHEFKAPLQQLSQVTAELQEGIMKTRMQPIGNAWQKLPRIVRDLATELGKAIELEMQGGETELDRQVLDSIRDPLTHMVRNSADHGIESVEERRRAAKPETGTIRLSAFHEGGQIVIEIADDGRGLDTGAIRAKALARELASEEELAKMSDAQVQRFIFVPGFSTARTVTEISGRGVGMDVVRNNVEQIGGTIDVTSVAGRGMRITIKIPLTLAIVSALVVAAGGDRFAIPQLAVSELVRVGSTSEHRIERIKGAALLRLREKLLPLVGLSHLLKIDDGTAGEIEDRFIVVLQVGSQSFGLVVDNVCDTEEIVVKPLSSRLRDISAFSGNTILGDGSVIMIVDPNGIAQAVGSTGIRPADVAEIAATAAPEAKTHSMLVFRAGSPDPKAVPISLVSRLEEIDVARIERADNRLFLQYRERLLPLVAANDDVRLRTEGVQPLVVIGHGTHSMGLLVDEIVDIVEDTLRIEAVSKDPAALGSAVIRGQATEILDVGYFLPLAFDAAVPLEPQAPASRALLLVEGTPIVRDMLTPLLSAIGFDVTAVAQAHEALALLRQERSFDVLVTDLDLAEAAGFDFVEAARREPARPGLLILGLAATVSRRTAERACRAGIDGVIGKFDRRGLVAALKAHGDDVDVAA